MFEGWTVTATEFNDIWAALFKLRAAIEDTETKLTILTNQRGAGHGDSSPSEASGPATGQGGGTQSDGPGRGQADVGTSPVAPRNPVDENGDPIRFGETIRVVRGRIFRYAGPCRTCGRPADVGYDPQPGTEGQHECFPCFLVGKRKEARR